MRMWMCNPSMMCNRHLLGEHCETHMFLGTLKKGIKVDGYIKNNLFEPLSLKSRHDELAMEMSIRGMKHNTPLEFDEKVMAYLGDMIYFSINREDSYNKLIYRCQYCRENEERRKQNGN
jgi:hypothetical protein